MRAIDERSALPVPRRRATVVWDDSAIRDLAAIVDYIGADSPYHARRWYARLRRPAVTLATFPYGGRVVPELADAGITTFRELVIPPYRVMYTINELVGDRGARRAMHVTILTVVDARRDLRDFLFKELVGSPPTETPRPAR